MSNPSDYDATNHPKGAEVFVGGLAQSITEAKIREVFSTCGEIVEVRMIKDLKGNSKGFCFVRFSTREAAIKAVKEKAGIKLEGRKIGVLPSAEHNSLFLGNLPKEWSPDEFDTAVRQVFEDVVSVNLGLMSSDGAPHSTTKLRNRGFGFVQFSSHAAAARAYRLGSRSDFVLGGKSHPTVKWAEEPEIDPDEFAKVKVAFVRDLPLDVNESFLKKLFGQYGEIEKVALSKKGQSQVGFVHFGKRLDLDTAVKEMHDKTINRQNGGSFKLQVEVARPFEKSKKRGPEVSIRNTSSNVSQTKITKREPAFTSSHGNLLKIQEEPVSFDPYEAAVVSLPVAIKDRLLRILRLGIATRYDLEMHCLRNLKEIPESSAISVLDQFLLSGGDEKDKGAFLSSLIAKVRSMSASRVHENTPTSSDIASVSRAHEYIPRSDFASIRGMHEYTPRTSDIASISRVNEYTPRTNDIASIRSDLARLSNRTQFPVVDLPSRVATTVSRYDGYSRRLSYSDYSLSVQAGRTQTVENNNTSPLPLAGLSPTYGRVEVNSPIGIGASHQSSRPPVRFDPYTGEPYKFDPFTGEPIQPGSASRSGGSLY